MPHVEWAQITHGSQEYGKDIVFRMKGGFTEDFLCACVIKNQKLTGAADDTKGVMTVLHQVKQAITHPFLDANVVEHRIGRAYVMTPHEVPQTTIRSVEGELTERGGQVHFICGLELLKQFETFYLALSNKPELATEMVQRTGARVLRDGTLPISQDHVWSRVRSLEETIEAIFPGYTRQRPSV
jgi:hypothetical protein